MTPMSQLWLLGKQLSPCRVKAAGCADQTTLHISECPSANTSQSVWLPVEVSSLNALVSALSLSICVTKTLALQAMQTVVCILFSFWVCSGHSLYLFLCSTSEIHVWV